MSDELLRIIAILEKLIAHVMAHKSRLDKLENKKKKKARVRGPGLKTSKF